MSGSMVEVARAKVNLFLHVVGRRGDGYHLLDSVVVFPPVGDVVSATAADTLTLSIGGPFGDHLAAETDNLVTRAARRLRDLRGVTAGAHLTLEKNLPVSSGIGGGSADAAAAIRALARLWNVAPPPAADTAALGADVPVCLASTPARMGGIGERLTTAPVLPTAGLVLVNPGVSVSTPDVFRARVGEFSAAAVLPSRWESAAALADDLRALRNDLERAACALKPVIANVLDAIAATPGCRLGRMSGSGATCFGLYDTPESARAAEAVLRRPGWWSWGGPIG